MLLLPALPLAARRLGGDATGMVLVVVMGLAGFVSGHLLMTYGLRYTTVAHSALLVSASPIFVSIFAVPLLGETFTPRKGLGLVVAFLGVGVLITSRQGLELSPRYLLGDLLSALASMSYSVNYVLGARLTRRYPAWSVTLLSLAAGSVFLLPLAAHVLPQMAVAKVGVEGWAAILYLVVFSTLLAYGLWYWASARGGASTMGAWQFLVPVAAVVVGHLLFREPVTWTLALAGAVILLGIQIVQRA